MESLFSAQEEIALKAIMFEIEIEFANVVVIVNVPEINAEIVTGMNETMIAHIEVFPIQVRRTTLMASVRNFWNLLESRVL